LTKDKNVIEEKFSINREDNSDPRQRNILVDKQLNRLKTTEAIDNAKTMADTGDLEKARNTLTNVAEEIKQSITGEDEYCAQLVEDLKTIKDTMRDNQSYKTEGDKMTNWIGKAHEKQRKAGGKSNYYANEAKSKMVSKYNDYISTPMKTDAKPKVNYKSKGAKGKGGGKEASLSSESDEASNEVKKPMKSNFSSKFASKKKSSNGKSSNGE